LTRFAIFLGLLPCGCMRMFVGVAYRFVGATSGRPPKQHVRAAFYLRGTLLRTLWLRSVSRAHGVLASPLLVRPFGVVRGGPLLRRGTGFTAAKVPISTKLPQSPQRSQRACTNRSPQPVRLHRSLKGADAATLKRIPSALAEIQGILFNRSRPAYAAARATSQGQEGGPGGMHHFAFPPAAFRRFRRAKAASDSALDLYHVPIIKQAKRRPHQIPRTTFLRFILQI
jgi:hypothetical protein